MVLPVRRAPSSEWLGYLAPRRLDDGGGGAVVRLLAIGRSSASGAEVRPRGEAEGIPAGTVAAALSRSWLDVAGERGRCKDAPSSGELAAVPE